MPSDYQDDYQVWQGGGPVGQEARWSVSFMGVDGRRRWLSTYGSVFGTTSPIRMADDFWFFTSSPNYRYWFNTKAEAEAALMECLLTQ